MGNPRANAAKDLHSQIARYMGDRSFDVNPMTFDQMNRITTNILTGDRSRALSQAGSLNAGRGYSLGLSNPFSLARRAEADVFDKYAGQIAGVTGSNIDRSFNQLFQSKNAKFGRLAQLLGLQSGNLSNMSAGAWNEVVGPLLGGLIGAGGNVLGGYFSGQGRQYATDDGG